MKVRLQPRPSIGCTPPALCPSTFWYLAEGASWTGSCLALSHPGLMLMREVS